MGVCHSCFSPPPDNNNDEQQNNDREEQSGPNNGVRNFQFSELVTATGHFRPDNLLGRGGFGKVYKGHLARLNQDVAVKQLALESSAQGSGEFVQEVITLSLVDHPNLVKLIGYCLEEDQKIIVYEYMPLKSLDRHLFNLGPDDEALDWNTRMRIAADVIKGLEYMHTTVTPKLIHRDIKSANVLLGENYHAKLSDFGLVKIAPADDKTHVTTRVLGTSGYCAPEYHMTGHLTPMADIYSFGVVLLEIITGRQAVDTSKPSTEQILAQWANSQFLCKNRRFLLGMADPLLQGKFSKGCFIRALSTAALCIQRHPGLRPKIDELVRSLVSLASPPSTSSSSTSQTVTAARR